MTDGSARYLAGWPSTQALSFSRSLVMFRRTIGAVLTRRRVDLAEEGFDAAFRIGHVDDPSLSATKLGPARVRYCASAGYLRQRGKPRTTDDLAKHECILVASDGAEVRWPFRGSKGPVMIAVKGRLRVNSFRMAHAAALAGLGVAIFPEFACAGDLRDGRLVSVLDDAVVDAGAVWLVVPAARYLAARVRAFVDLAVERFAPRPPWVIANDRSSKPPNRR